jgi:hypothetical protein
MRLTFRVTEENILFVLFCLTLTSFIKAKGMYNHELMKCGIRDGSRV